MKNNCITLIVYVITTLFININIFAQETGKMTDSRDSLIYKTVKIGEQWWMAENLKFLADKDFIQIKGLSVFSQYIGTDYQRYGVHYSWEAAKQVCPDGWHLPNMDEWYSLINSFGDFYDTNDNSSIKKESSKKRKERKKLRKEINTALMEDGLSGFDILYGGYIDPNPYQATTYNPNKNFLQNLGENLANHPGNYFSMGTWALFWSSDDNVEKGMFKKQKANGFQFQKPIFVIPFYPKSIKKHNGCSVRCVKDK